MPVLARRRRGQPSRLRTVSVPAPLGGLNTVAAGTSMAASDCLALWNMVPGQYGLRTRLGSREYCTGLDGDVRSLLPFTGSAKGGGLDRLFACTSSGIWDVSASSSSPTRVVTFVNQGSDSGWGSSTVFVTIAGHWLVYCDEANGAFLYQESTNTWTHFSVGSGGPAQVTGTSNGQGVDPTRFAHVCSWKNMLWFTERDSGRAWYLPVGQVGGTVQAFIFGSRFKAGGDLRCLTSWTFNGGDGIDDAIVAVSGGGDVVVYKGTDPSQASGFYLAGVWFVGAVPAGRTLTTEMGGDVAVMCALGLLPLSQLTSGMVIAATQYQTFKIGNVFNQLQAQTTYQRGWAARLHPADNQLLILVPGVGAQAPQQLAMSMVTKGWAQYRWPAAMTMGACAEAWEGKLYFGTADGRVCVQDGDLDGVTLATPGVGTPIDFSLLTAFQNLGRPTQKRVQIIRPTFLGQALPQYQAVARFRWDLSEPAIPAAPSTKGWDVDSWDDAIWDGGATQAQQNVFGAVGCGPEVALAIRGQASSRLTLVGVDVAFDEGGLL